MGRLKDGQKADGIFVMRRKTSKQAGFRYPIEWDKQLETVPAYVKDNLYPYLRYMMKQLLENPQAAEKLIREVHKQQFPELYPENNLIVFANNDMSHEKERISERV